MRIITVALVLTIVIIDISILSAQEMDTVQHPVAKVIALNANGKDYLRILGGPPESSTLHSGLVTLRRKASVGKHNTEKYEEMVIVLRGTGIMKITGGPDLSFKAGQVVYCPSHTEHDVLNTGRTLLRYVYVVAETDR
ncbi:MAG TPA: cupin domain-containing protein [Bacteroidota bacterium]|nr:cupin domain-containing protein [Bacteroidota bacterium]